MAREVKSQQLWTDGEALERSGQAAEAMGLYVKAALAEERAGQGLRARLLWERIAERTGPTGTVLERLGMTSVQAKLTDDAYDYFRAAATRYRAEGRPDDAERVWTRAVELESGVTPHDAPVLAMKVLGN